MSAFDKVINRILSSEGGYVNHPKDPGGETNWGISKRSYPNLDIKNLTRQQAIDIYKRDFWDKIRADKMHPALAFQVLDFAVNSGIGTAIKKLQVVANVPDDGNWGPVTESAVAKMSPVVLTLRFIAERADYWRKLPTWQTFGAGWTGRLADNIRYASQDL
jgi:lysozyme family protein